jgi:short-chain fatty acids transporter
MSNINVTMPSKTEYQNDSQKGILSDFIYAFARWSVRWIPDSMVFVLVLSFATFFLSWGLSNHGPIQLVNDWTKGFWVMLTYAMQMCLILITGFTVADSRLVKIGLRKIVDLPKTKTQTILMFSFITGILWWLHWGIGMMASLIMGREIAVRKRGMGIHYPLIAAISYCGIVLCNGPSCPAQLLVATPGNFLEKMLGVIPLTLTTFDTSLLITNLILFLTLPFIYLASVPKSEHAMEIDPEYAKAISATEKEEPLSKDLTPAEKWERSRLLMSILGLAGLGWSINYLFQNGITRLDLNTLNFLFLMLGIVLHGTPKNFIESVQRGTSTVYGIIIQFPLYAGIFGMISYSGMAEIIANWFVAISTAYTFPWIVYIYSGIVDMFVPSAGSKFMIEAPYIIPAAKMLGASIPKTINAYSWSVAWNPLQPFWAIPVLGAFKLKFQDILPFGFVVFIWCLLVVSFGQLVLPLIFG